MTDATANEDGRTTFYHYARPWLPTGIGRPLISASDGERNGFFAYLNGQVRRVPKPPAGEFVPGYERAAAKIERLMRRPGIRDFAHDPVFTLFRS